MQRSSKPRNNALHADCGKVTIVLAARAAATIRVFSPYAALPRANAPSFYIFLTFFLKIFVLHSNYLPNQKTYLPNDFALAKSNPCDKPSISFSYQLPSPPKNLPKKEIPLGISNPCGNPPACTFTVKLHLQFIRANIHQRNLYLQSEAAFFWCSDFKAAHYFVQALFHAGKADSFYYVF